MKYVYVLSFYDQKDEYNNGVIGAYLDQREAEMECERLTDEATTKFLSECYVVEKIRLNKGKKS